jgi:hypothetical protein
MKKIAFIFYISISLLAVSCGETTPEPEKMGVESQNAAATEKTANDLLLEEILAYHDEAMPKIGKLRGYQTLAQTKIDSVAKLKDAASKQLKTDYENLLTNLKDAEKGMMDWMDTFNPEPEMPNAGAMKDYYEAEKVKAKAMRDNIFSTLESAVALLGN